MRSIYCVLVTAFLIGIYLLIISYDYACQLQKYDFGNQTVLNSWIKDFLLNFGSGLCSTIFLIFAYDEFQKHRVNKDLAKRKTIATKKLCKRFKLFLQVAYFDLVKSTKKTMAHRRSINEIKDVITENFFVEINKINFMDYEKSYKMNKIQVLNYHLQLLQMDTKNILNVYEPYISGELVELIEDIIDGSSPYIQIVKASADLTKTAFEPTSIDINQDIKDHMNKIINLVEKFEEEKN